MRTSIVSYFIRQRANIALATSLVSAPLMGCAVDEPGAPSSGETPRPAIEPHWNALIARAGGEPSVRWSDHGTPMTVYGGLSAAYTPSPEAAWGFLSDNAALLQLSDGLAELEDTTTVASPLGTHVTFAQRYQGVPVHGAEVKVHFNQDGRVVGLNNTAIPDLAVDTQPRISAERALAIALAATTADRRDVEAPEPATLVITGDAGAPALAYHVVVPTNGPTLEYFISAHTGAVLTAPVDINRYVDGTGQVFRDNAVVATQNNNLIDSNDSASAVPASAYSVVTLQGLNGNNRLDGQFASGSNSLSRAVGTNNNFIFLRNTAAFNETMAYFHFDFAQRYIQSLGFTNVNNRQQIYNVDRSTADNSSYSPSNKRITLGTGGVDDAEDGEVIIHEYGHSVQDNQVPGFGRTLEGGSMGEGFGDYLAGTVSSALVGDFQLTCIAEWDAVSYASGIPHCLRRLDSTKHYPEDVAGEVHDDGEMWSASLFQIRTALGAAKADKVIIQAHFLLSASANFRDGSNAIVTAAINLGLTAAEVTTIRTILRARGFTVTA